jgi:hypothetical protein
MPEGHRLSARFFSRFPITARITNRAAAPVVLCVFQKSVSRAKAWWLAATNRWRTATLFVARPGLSSPVVSEDEKKQTDVCNHFHKLLFFVLFSFPASLLCK